LGRVCQIAREHHLRSIGLPLLGRRHGDIARQAFIHCFLAILSGRDGDRPLNWWLIVSDPAATAAVYQILQEAADIR
jgi:hypothetical protein